MKLRWLLASFLIATCGVFLGVSIATRHAYLNGFKTRPFTYGQDDVVRVLREGGIKIDVVDWVRRDALGAKLFVFLSSDQTSQTRIVTISTNGLSSAVAPGRRAFADREGNWVAWTDDYTKGLHLKSG